MVECLRQFEAHLDGRHFQLQTDHKALPFLNKSKLLNKRLARWALWLLDFDFSISYRPGSTNGNADGLSRQAWDIQQGDEVSKIKAQLSRGLRLKEEGMWGPHPTTVLLTYCKTFILYVCLYVVCVLSFNSCCSSSCILCIIFMLPRLLVTICVNVCSLI